MSSDKTKDKEMVGGYIPDRLFQLINLHKIAEGASKTQILHDALLLWVAHNDINIEDLIAKVRREEQAKWLRILSNDNDADPYDFVDSEIKRLKEKKVAPRIIDKIFEHLFE